MIQHVLPKGFQRIRYYGVQATKTFEKVKGIIQEALAKVKKVVHGAIQIITPKNYRERYQESTGKDPFICPRCGEEMGLWKIWHPKYGIIYSELEEMRKGKYEKYETKAKEATANTNSGGGTIRPAPKRVQLSLFGVWNGASC
jgi:transcription initiation factor IIE alpha subunit